MGQHLTLELSDEAKKELTIGLLREWWIVATQAFVEKTSSEIALKALRPYFIHNGRDEPLPFLNANPYRG
jgi:hypothetical protein